MSAPPAEPLHRRLRRALRRARRRVLLHRRPVAALAVAGAVLAATRSVSPPAPETVEVWTAAHDLAGGSRLASGDLTRTPLPPDAVPDGAVRRAATVVGRTLTGPMRRGEVLTSTRTLAPGLLARLPGRTAVPVRLADAEVVGLLRVGDEVTLVAADPDGRADARTLAAGVPVLALPRPRSSPLGGSQQGRLVVLAVPDDAATDVAARATTGALSVVWSR